MMPTGMVLPPPKISATGQKGTIYTELLTVVYRNVIPPLAKPWNGSQGSLTINGNRIFHFCEPQITFTLNSTEVIYDAHLAQFNLDPGDSVVAVYSSSQ